MLRILKRLSLPLLIPSLICVFIQTITMLWLPHITTDIVDNGVMAGKTAYVWSKVLPMTGLSLAYLVGALLGMYLFSKLSYKLGEELRFDIYRKTLRFSRYEFDKIGTSSLVTRSTTDVTQVQTLVEMVCKALLTAVVMLVGGVIMTWLLSPALGLIYLIAIPLLLVAYFIIYHFVNPLYEKMRTVLDSLNLTFREGLTGVRVIRAFNREEQEYEKYRSANRSYTRTSVTAETYMGVLTPLITLILSLTGALIVWAAGKGVAAGTIQIGAIMGAIGYALYILRGFGVLTQVILAVPRGIVSSRRINEILDLPISITDPVTSVSLVSKAGTTLVFDTVSFKYQGAEKNALDSIDLSVSQGQTLAVIGSTGAGKTSLCNLLSRLYDVDTGAIRINGVDIRDIRQHDLHELVSYAPQRNFLFQGTIRSNMLRGKPSATDDEIWAALDAAQATEFIAGLDNGLDSPVEKVGGNFSGGQRQRLCIARTLLKSAAVYVFDDSFSALDFKTEANVRLAMKDQLGGAITLIVAQRISTVMNADLIAVLDNGKLAGLGTHENLKLSNPVYQEIISSQFYKEESAV